ncbi:MAG: rhomboid family intramembrane serine protease [Pirellulales bacterium]|nr:rhomboid family intramembrane serine protease [Pirellulales bacterium]
MLPRPEISFQRTPVTLIIAAVVVALEVVCTFDEFQHPDDAGRRLMYYNDYLGLLPRLWAGQLWRPFTSTLMHGGPLHAGFNVYVLLIFGPALEHRLGSYRMLGLIVLLGYVSMMPEYVIGSFSREEPIMIVGLSGIVYGLFGILWIGRRWHPDLAAVCSDQTVRVLLGWFVLCIVLTYANVMSVANIAHGAGFGFGVLYGLAFFDVRHRVRWAVLATVASLLVLATLFGFPGHRGYEHVKNGGRLWWSRAGVQEPESPLDSRFC